MSVFDEPPPEEVRDRRLPRWIVPPEEVGVYVEARRLLLQTPDTGLVLTDVVAYSCGFRLGVDVLRRSGDAITALVTMFDLRVHRAGGKESVDETKALKLSIEFSDGRHAANTDADEIDLSEPEAGEVRVFEGGGGGNGVQRSLEWWVTPLPPQGPIGLAIEWWPADEVVRAELDAAPILDAAARSIPTWRDLRERQT